VDTRDEVEDIIIGECIESLAWEVDRYRSLYTVYLIAKIYMIEIVSQYLIFVHPSLDPECTDCFVYLLSDSTILSSVVCVLEILFGECRSATYDTASLDILYDTRHLPTYIDATMFMESAVLYSDDRIQEPPREASLIGDHVPTSRSLVHEDGTMSISEHETPI
jgi:hypothetical protein